MSNDLISRSALIQWIDDSVSQYGYTYSTDMLNMWGLFKDYLINNAPTVPNEYMRGYEAAEREYKRPTGEWIMNKTSPRGRNYTCTHCNKISRNKSEYCPKCGAKMKEAEND